MAYSVMCIYKEVGGDGFKNAMLNWEPDMWLLFDEVPSEFHNLENYKLSREIKNSGLAKVMSEIEEDVKIGTKSSSKEET